MLVNRGLIYGLGVSMIKATDKFCGLVEKYPNAIIHVINGIVTLENLEKLYDKNLKVLILGYKHLRRGVDYYSDAVKKNQDILKKELGKIVPKFFVVSFDNLALEQLDVKRFVGEKYWQQFYMGDDGKFTMYVDLVKREFSKSSTCMERYSIRETIDEMFNIAREIG